MSYEDNEDDYFFDIPDDVKSKLALKPKEEKDLVVDDALFKKAQEVETFYAQNCG